MDPVQVWVSLVQFAGTLPSDVLYNGAPYLADLLCQLYDAFPEAAKSAGAVAAAEAAVKGGGHGPAAGAAGHAGPVHTKVAGRR